MGAWYSKGPQGFLKLKPKPVENAATVADGDLDCLSENISSSKIEAALKSFAAYEDVFFS
jgi:hypothetical protein